MAVSDISSGLTDIGSAVSELFGAAGAGASSAQYTTAAGIATENAQISQASANLQQIQLKRQAYQTIGGQQAQVAGAGMANSGSAMYLMRSSTQQANLQQAVAREQGLITTNAYEEQAGVFQAMASAASSAQTGATISGAVSAIAGGVGLVSGLANISTGGGSTVGSDILDFIGGL